MKRAVFVAIAAAVGFGFALSGCGGDGDLRQEMQQEQREDIIDEREDERLQAPDAEYRQEQREDRLDEAEDLLDSIEGALELSGLPAELWNTFEEIQAIWNSPRAPSLSPSATFSGC